MIHHFIRCCEEEQIINPDCHYPKIFSIALNICTRIHKWALICMYVSWVFHQADDSICIQLVLGHTEFWSIDTLGQSHLHTFLVDTYIWSLVECHSGKLPWHQFAVTRGPSEEKGLGLCARYPFWPQVSMFLGSHIWGVAHILLLLAVPFFIFLLCYCYAFWWRPIY